MARSVDYNEKLMESLKDSEEAAAYLNAVLAENDPALFLKALKKVADANGGVGKIAAKTQVSRVGLYKAFSENGNPGFKTVEDVLAAFNLSLFVKPADTGRNIKRSKQGKPRKLAIATG